MLNARKTIDIYYIYVIKYMSVRVFVTDGMRDQPQGSKNRIYCRPSGQSYLYTRGRSAPLYFNFILRSVNMKKVGILMGSDSDLPIVEKGINVLRDYGIPFEVHVYSAHRTPAEAAEFVKSARANGFGVMIAAAGMAAHLAGAVAANTTLPVIGIPISCKNTGGVDALWSTVQMPSGIPVATVAIDGAANAAHLAAEILALSDGILAEKLEAKRKEAASLVLEKNRAVEEKYNV